MRVKDFEGAHELDDAAGFKSLARVGGGGAQVFIAREAATGELAVFVHDFVVIQLGGFEETCLLGLEPILGRLADALHEIHIVLGGEFLSRVVHRVRVDFLARSSTQGSPVVL
jgi:hypothetical protein